MEYTKEMKYISTTVNETYKRSKLFFEHSMNIVDLEELTERISDAVKIEIDDLNVPWFGQSV